MVRYLRSDATHLSDKDIQEIINAKNTMKRASEVMAAKYKISSRRVYQIWRGVHPPIDPTTEHYQNLKSTTEDYQTVPDSDSSKCHEDTQAEVLPNDPDWKIRSLFDRQVKREEKNKMDGYNILTEWPSLDIDEILAIRADYREALFEDE